MSQCHFVRPFTFHHVLVLLQFQQRFGPRHHAVWPITCSTSMSFITQNDADDAVSLLPASLAICALLLYLSFAAEATACFHQVLAGTTLVIVTGLVHALKNVFLTSVMLHVASILGFIFSFFSHISPIFLLCDRHIISSVSVLYVNPRPSSFQKLSCHSSFLSLRTALFSPSSSDQFSLLMFICFLNSPYSFLAASVACSAFLIARVASVLDMDIDSDLLPHFEDRFHGVLHHQPQKYHTESAP